MPRWSGVGEPDDPLAADDAVVGSSEDVLSDAGPDDDEPAEQAGSEPVAPRPDDLDATSIVSLDDLPTAEFPPVVASAPEPRGWTAGMAPWAVFVAVAVVVIAATSTWAAWLQGPTADRQSVTPMLQPVPTISAVAPPPVAEAAPSPSPEPVVEPEPEPDPKPVVRPTQRQRATRAPAPAPPAAAVNAPPPATAGERNGGEPSATLPPPSPAGAAAATDEEQTPDVEETDSTDEDKDKSASEDDN